jgi:glycosyltransferase involved in cell wall biosynthesis
MRILSYLTNLEASGGVALNLLQVGRELVARGHHLDLVYGEDGDIGDAFRSICDSVVATPSPRYYGGRLGDTRRIVAGARVASRARPDIVYVHNYSELAWALTVRLRTGARIVCHLHDLTSTGRAYRELVAGRVSRFVAVSEWLRSEWVRNGVDACRIEVIPNGIRTTDYPPASPADRQRSREAFGLPPDAYVVLYAGRVEPIKGTEVLLDAWERLGLAPDKALLLILGGRPDLYVGEYEQQLRDRSVPGCDWQVMRPDVVSAMHAADVLVLPSVGNESFGRVIIEAMSTGIPAVAAAVGGVPEVLGGEFERMLFPRGDAAALAERLRDLAGWRRDDPGLADRCAEYVAGRYELADTVTRLETVFASASPKRR